MAKGSQEGNEITSELVTMMGEKLASYASNEAVRAIFFTSRSPDIFSLSKLGSDKSVGALATNISEYKKPTFAVFGGDVTSSAYGLFAGSRYRLGSTNTSLQMQLLAGGLGGGAGAVAYYMSRSTPGGMAMARYLFASERELRADDMLTYGLITHLCEEKPHTTLMDALGHIMPDEDSVAEVEEALEELLTTMDARDVPDFPDVDVMDHELWDQLVLVVPGRPDTVEKDEPLLEDDLSLIHEEIEDCFGGKSVGEARQKCEAINKPWAKSVALVMADKEKEASLEKLWALTAKAKTASIQELFALDVKS